MSRNDLVLEDYMHGKTIAEISRMHGVSLRRVYQILEAQGVPRNRNNGMKPPSPTAALSRRHEMIGRKAYDFYFNQELTRVQAAGQLGWTVAKLRSVEQGRINLTLFDLQDLATWMRTSVGDLIDGRG